MRDARISSAQQLPPESNIYRVMSVQFKESNTKLLSVSRLSMCATTQQPEQYGEMSTIVCGISREAY